MQEPSSAVSSPSNFDSQGFVYEAGQYTTLNYPGAMNTNLGGINNAGLIAGSWADASGYGGGFIYSNGQFRQVLITGVASPDVATINNNGDIAGSFINASGLPEIFLGTGCN